MVITLLVSTIASGQQISLKGQITIHNSKYNTGELKFVPNAYLTAPFTKPANSDSEGNFNLEFVGLDPGTSIQLQVEKSGLEVVNAYDLQDVVISRKVPVRVFLIEKGKLAEAQTELYNISKSALFARKDALIARLKKGDQESKDALKELEAYFGHPIKNRFEAEQELIKRIKDVERRLPSFAQELAKQNLDFASDMYIKAFEFYKAGKIEEALSVLDSTQLDDSYNKAQSTLAESKKLAQTASDLEEQANLQIAQVVESYLLKAESLQLLFKYSSAIRVYHKLEAIYLDNDLDLEKLAGIYDQLSMLYRSDGNYPKAIAFSEQAIRLKKQVLAPNSPFLAKTHQNLGLIYHEIGKLDNAKEQLELALAIQEKQDDLNDPSLAKTYNTLGNLLIDFGDYERAMSYQNRAIAIQEEQLGPRNPDLAYSMFSLGILYQYLEENIKSKEVLLQALDIQLENYGEMHPDVAMCYSMLGGAYAELGLADLAEESLLKAIEIQEVIYNKEHIYLSSSYNNLGVIYSEFGQPEKGLEYMQKSLDTSIDILGEDHFETGNSYTNIAGTYLELGNPEKALELEQKALEIKMKALGENHYLIKDSYEVLSNIYWELGEYETAILYVDKAANVRKQLVNFKPTDAAIDILYKAKLYKALDDYDKALGLAEEALKIQKKHLDKNNPDFVSTYAFIGGLYQDSGNQKKANSYLEKIMDIANNAEIPPSASLGNLFNTAARSLADSGSLNEAESLQLKTIAIQEEVQDNNSQDLAVAYYTLAYIKQLKKEFSAAFELYQKALTISLNEPQQPSPVTSNVNYRMAQIYLEQAKYKESLEAITITQRIESELYGETHPFVLESVYLLMELNARLGNKEAVNKARAQIVAIQNEVDADAQETIAEKLITLDQLVSQMRKQD